MSYPGVFLISFADIDEILNTFFSFSNNVIIFRCRYSRSINVDGLMSVDQDVQPEVGRGDLTYSMTVMVGPLGGTTKVQITPNHNFGDKVGAR